jgi:undecaprenyl-diphosphatase
MLIVLGSIPAAVVGLTFEDFFEGEGRNLPLVAISLIFFGILLWVADRSGQKTRDLKEITWKDSFFIGLSQALALIPGVSRSGITITSALFRNFDREAATKFSFLLSTPAIVGASLLKGDEIITAATNSQSQLVFLLGTLAAAVSGFLAIKVLLKFVQTNSFGVFVFYRLVLGGAILLWIIGI